MLTKKYVYMDMLPDGYGSYGGGRRIISTPEVTKELSLQEQLKLMKEEEKLKEKQPSKFQSKL